MSSLFKKLNFKNERDIYVVNAPENFHAHLDEVAGMTHIRRSIEPEADVEFFLGFVTLQKEVDQFAAKLSGLSKDATLWFAYPKSSSKKLTCDFNRDKGWEALGKLGLEPVRMVSIDADWTALRFRKTAYIKQLTRKKAISEDGKKRISSRNT